MDAGVMPAGVSKYQVNSIHFSGYVKLVDPLWYNNGKVRGESY